VDKDLRLRKLTEEENESMPEDWVRILEDLNKKKLAIVFKLE
jgi:Mg/Co/Ni transporter MgtE